MKLDEESLNQIVDALMATPQMQFVTDQMSASPPGPGGMDQLPSPSAGAPGDEVPPAPGETGPDDDLSDLDDILGGDDDEPSPNPQTPEKNGMKYRNQPGGEVTREQYSQIKGRLDEYVEKYALLDKAHQHAMATIGQQGERLQVLERTAADAVRSERLTQVANDHPGFPMDLEEERKATLYSLGASMDDEAFEKHVATIEKYASRFVERVDIPGGAVPVGETQKEQYEARLSREAVKIATRYADSHGTSMNYDEALAAAREIVKQ